MAKSIPFTSYKTPPLEGNYVGAFKVEPLAGLPCRYRINRGGAQQRTAGKMAATKGELQAQLERIQNNYVVALAACHLLASCKVDEELRTGSCAFGDFNVDFAQLSPVLKDPRSWEEDGVLRDFFLVQYRSLLRDTFEVIKGYSHKGQIQNLRAAPWFNFARLVRDALAHNFHWKLTQEDLKHPPYKWNGRVIEHALHGHPMKLAFLGFDGAMELHKDMRGWAEANLN